MALITFTANHEDLSTDKGYQFKFYCDKCGNGHMTRFQPSITGMAGGFLRAAGDLFGGVLSRAGNSAYEIQRAVGGKAHDDAFAAAVAEAKGFFKQCTRCGKWVCPEVCWNGKAGLCEECAPDFEEQFSASKAQAMSDAARNQLYEKAQQTDYTADVDMRAGASTPQSALACPTCGAKTTGGKFCPECGGPLQIKLSCTGCGFTPEGTPKFCPECGVKMPSR
jgi:membrane protease subunit (stomatin/prohibitin family)